MHNAECTHPAITCINFGIYGIYNISILIIYSIGDGVKLIMLQASSFTRIAPT